MLGHLLNYLLDNLMIQFFSALIKADIIDHVRHLGGSIRLGAHGSGTAAGCGRHACSLRPRSDCSSLTRTIASIWSRLRYLPTCVEIRNLLLRSALPLTFDHEFIKFSLLLTKIHLYVYQNYYLLVILLAIIHLILLLFVLIV